MASFFKRTFASALQGEAGGKRGVQIEISTGRSLRHDWMMAFEPGPCPAVNTMLFSKNNFLGPTDREVLANHGFRSSSLDPV